MRITGQRGPRGEWKSGSVDAIREMDNVHRMAWFLAYGNEASGFSKTSMFNEQGEFLPVGRALFNDLDPDKADCEAEPTGV